MTLTTSITTFLDRQGGTFHAARTEDPVNALATKLGQRPTEVRAALSDLSQQDRIWIRRQGGALPPAIGLYRRQRRGSPETAEGKRQRMFARDVPAHLPNSLCGPVEISYITPSKPKAGDEQMETSQNVLMLQDDFQDLTQILNALQGREVVSCTVESGCVHDYGVSHARLTGTNSCVQLIMELFPQLSQSRAERFNRLLGSAGVRFTVRLGGGKYDQFIRTDVVQVVPVMLHGRDESPDEVLEFEPEAPAEAPVSDELDEFLSYTEGLRTENARLLTEHDVTMQELEQLRELNARQAKRIRELEQQLATVAHDAALAQRLRGLLAASKQVVSE